jgi:hypothetical protein
MEDMVAAVVYPAVVQREALEARLPGETRTRLELQDRVVQQIMAAAAALERAVGPAARLALLLMAALELLQAAAVEVERKFTSAEMERLVRLSSHTANLRRINQFIGSI